MTVDEKKEEGKIILYVTGRVDTTTAPDLQTAIFAAFQKENDIVVDFAEVEYVSSAGLRALLLGQKTANSKGGSMVVKNANDSVKEIFSLTGFKNILNIE